MTGLRQKMEQVESRFEECYTMMENTEGTVKELWGAAEETKALATSLIREAVEKMQAEFKERDEEMDHKFSNSKSGASCSRTRSAASKDLVGGCSLVSLSLASTPR